jgi:hypothetical protein
MYLNKQDIDLFRGEVLKDLSRDELMDSILSFLSSIFNYNSVVEKDARVNIIDIFAPHKNVSEEEINYEGGGIDLEKLATEELKQLTVDTFISYTMALTGLRNNPMLPLMEDSSLGIRVIEHTV